MEQVLGREVVKLKIAFAIFLTLSYRTPATSGLTHPRRKGSDQRSGREGEGFPLLKKIKNSYKFLEFWKNFID